MARRLLIWGALALVVLVPLGLAAGSPLLAWREPVYIVAGFAGVLGMVLLLVQPLLAGGLLPGLEGLRGRRAHGFVGLGLVVAVVVHVAGLWVTSPPDVVDALLLRSPTPFSVWGVIAMWAIFTAAVLALGRQKLGLRPRVWRFGHTGLALVVVAGSVVHALLIDGTMESMSKIALSALALLATLKVVGGLWMFLLRRRERA
ncbi:ferric reductase [Marimonas sp. MJW-29]|uniref:Ferric reductase n=1 Tax=Sulfitobacter sediminis TaxID=3234186 RepID=A0ABV3RQC5_9RHOB